MPHTNFFFGPNARIAAGSANFAARIATAYASYGLSEQQAAAFGALNDALQAAHLAATTPATRTSVAVAERAAAVKAMRAEALRLAKVISATPTVSDAQLLELGLLPRPVRRRVGPPATAPRIEVGVCRGRLVVVRLRPADAHRRGIEVGARGANLYSFVGPNPPTDPRDWRYERMTTRAITQLEFPGDVPSGATVWLSACWVTARGATSPAAAPTPFTLQGGVGVSPAAAA